MKLNPLIPLIFALVVQPLAAAVSLGTDDKAAVPAKVEGPMKEALDAFNEGRHVKAIDIARPLAENGNSDALFLLGFAYESGRGVEMSREKALEYYGKASTAGQKDATYRLALILLSSKEKTERDQGKKKSRRSRAKRPRQRW